MTALVEVPFHGDKLQAVQATGSVWVVVRRVCEALGIDESGQRQKLKEKAWATTELISAVAEDGKVREAFAIHLDSLPMWLATIEPSRVRPEVRAKLIAYQRECARVLRDHFFGGQATVALQLPGGDESVIRRSKAALEMVLAAKDLLDPYAAKRIAETLIERVGQLQLPAPVDPTLEVDGYLQERGETKEVIRRFRGSFGKRLRALYVQTHDREPGTTPKFINGADRSTRIYHESDRPLFDAVYRDMFGGRELEVIAGGKSNG